MRTATTRRLTLPLTAGLLLALSGCASDDAGTPATSDASAGASGASGLELVTEGSLTVCTNPPYEPFEFTDDSGAVVGLDLDLMGEVAADLGVEPEIVIAPFEGIETGQVLEVGTCDVLASAITITEERQGKFDFSEPYFDADQGLLVPAGSDLSDVESLQGATVAVQQATTGEAWAEENGLAVVQFEDLGLQVAALESGQVDAVVNDFAVLQTFVEEGFEVATNFDTGEQYGFGVRKGHTALLDAVDATLERVRTDGTYDALYTEWIGVAPTEG
jgi:polar amino acid transport system substrate-binding protein